LDDRTREELIAILPRLRRFAWGLTGNRDDADDLVQACCERAISRIHQWQTGTRLDSWMFRIMQTMRIDEIRSQATRAQLLETGHAELEEDYEATHDAEFHFTVDAVQDALALLPEEQRMVVLLIAVEGYSYKEAAQIMQVPMGTITSRLTRARVALNQTLGAAPAPRARAVPI
jgi:RNA polymerase sigma-70 factor (ECF subfamily)